MTKPLNHKTVPCQILIPKELHYRFKLLVATEKSNLRERIIKLIEDDVVKFEEREKDGQ